MGINVDIVQKVVTIIESYTVVFGIGLETAKIVTAVQPLEVSDKPRITYISEAPKTQYYIKQRNEAQCYLIEAPEKDNLDIISEHYDAFLEATDGSDANIDIEEGREDQQEILREFELENQVGVYQGPDPDPPEHTPDAHERYELKQQQLSEEFQREIERAGNEFDATGDIDKYNEDFEKAKEKYNSNSEALNQVYSEDVPQEAKENLDKVIAREQESSLAYKQSVDDTEEYDYNNSLSW